MCRHISKEQQIEGWRAVGALLPTVELSRLGAAVARAVARLRLRRRAVG